MIFFDVLKCDSTYNWEKKVANYSECPQISHMIHLTTQFSIAVEYKTGISEHSSNPNPIPNPFPKPFGQQAVSDD